MTVYLESQTFLPICPPSPPGGDLHPLEGENGGIRAPKNQIKSPENPEFFIFVPKTIQPTSMARWCQQPRGLEDFRARASRGPAGRLFIIWSTVLMKVKIKKKKPTQLSILNHSHAVVAPQRDSSTHHTTLHHSKVHPGNYFNRSPIQVHCGNCPVPTCQ